ncbi:MAG: hypothetical protein MZU91_08585 [Desulfosudis oleivorans]|nr:hypothetical protein [Desulfosudis oleivorans]
MYFDNDEAGYAVRNAATLRRLLARRVGMIGIDGGFGEGGGQLVRMACALAAITATPIRIDNIRARRDPPGLAPQHLAAVRAVAALCDADCEGLALRAREFTLRPGRIRSGTFRFDVGTAGSITLVLQALLPVALAAPGAVRIRVRGGTDVRAAPPLDYLRFVLLPLLARLGIRAGLRGHAARLLSARRRRGAADRRAGPAARSGARYAGCGRGDRRCACTCPVCRHISLSAWRAPPVSAWRGSAPANLQLDLFGPDRAAGPGGCVRAVGADRAHRARRRRGRAARRAGRGDRNARRARTGRRCSTPAPRSTCTPATSC